jgi:predicted TIM-barrel fold metal-dependent hydrolase
MQIPILDSHHHIWRQKDLPWLMGPMVPRIFGPYEPLRRDYLIAEYLADIAGSGVVKSVHVQANAADPEAEAAWVQRTAEETGWPHAIVAFADLTAADVRPALDRLARFPLVRGIRMQIHWHAKPQYRFAPRPDLADDPVFRRNFAALADYGFTFDLQIFDRQAESAVRLARDFPQTTLVLQHAGMPEDLTEAGRERWRSAMRRLAAERNVVTKLSALGTFIHRNDPAHIARIVSDTLAIFGPERCLFGSNFPIEKLWTDYASLIGAYRAAIPDPAIARAVFHDTAARVYRLGPH